MNRFVSILNTDKYTINGSKISFIENDKRPYWSQRVDLFYQDKKLPMGRLYTMAKIRNANDQAMTDYYSQISSVEGVIIDLATGVTGYIGPMLDILNEKATFVITDASKQVINAHQVANKKRKQVVVCDIDLSKSLPFLDNSVDCYCGNLINNVDNYNELIKEISRTLKKKGKFVVIEWFFDEDSETSQYLKMQNSLIQSISYYEKVLDSNNLKLVKDIVQSESRGKLAGDVLPINPNDKKEVHILYFEKQ